MTNARFGMRPNWVVRHPVMYGNAYNQSIYTHLRGIAPHKRWKSERELARTVAEETGFTESTCRKSLAALKKFGFVRFTESGTVEFGAEEEVLSEGDSGYGGSQNGYTGSQIGYGGNQSGYGGSQIGYGGNHYSHMGQGFPPPIYRYINTEIVDRDISAPDGADSASVLEEVNLIIGSDPEEVAPAPTKIPNQPLQVFDYFNFTARTSGAQPITDPKDRVAFLAIVKRSINRGVSVQTYKRMIDAFFQFDRNREHRAPWKVFTSNETHRSLLARLENVSVNLNDSVLNWIANDFKRTETLPWDEEFDSFFQTLVHRSGMSVAYRYPELLSAIAKRSSGSTDLATDLLVCAATLIDKYLHNTDTETTQLKKTLEEAGIELPNDLRPKKIRKEATTLKEAVLTAHRLN